MLNDLLTIFLSFAKIGAVAYGGGPSMVPILKAEVIERRKWIEIDDFMDILAIGNALPGPIITKMAAAIGYHKRGLLGAVAALTGIILPSAVTLLILMRFVYIVKDNPLITSALRGLRPVVVAMLAYAALDMTPNAIKGIQTIVICVIALSLMIFSPIHSAFIIIIGAIVGIGLKL